MPATLGRSFSAACSARRKVWIDGAGEAFNPGNYYYVGGNTKLYGAVLLRYRAQDFAPIAYRDGSTLVGHLLMTNSSLGTRGLRSFIGFMARSDSIRPNRIIPSRSRSVPCRTNRRLRTFGSG